MKKLNALQIVIYLFLTIIISCSGGTNGPSDSSDTVNQESTTAQELELPQKRIVYQIPEMEDVVCHKGIIYQSTNGLDLKADIYLPPEVGENEIYPIVILVNDYPDSVINEYWGRDQKDMELFVSWAELIAASGMVAVTYQTQFSHFETDSLISFLSKNAKDYNIAINKLGVFGCSANTLAAQSLMQNDNYDIDCAVLYYGILLTPDQKYYSLIDSSANMFGFYFSDLRKITEIPESIPVLVTRAGNDRFEIVLETTDHYISESLKSNTNLTYINYPEGQHDFDILDDTETSRLIIKQTVEFLRTHLNVN